MYKAAILLYPEALATSVTLPAEILGAAAQMSRATSRVHRPAEVQLLSAMPGEAGDGVGVGVGASQGEVDAGLGAVSAVDPAMNIVTLSSGIRLQIDGHLKDVENCDLLILPAIWRHPRRVITRCTPLLPVIKRVHQKGGQLCSVGSASSLLAEAGLLDGRPATTHWHDFPRFAQAYPAVDLKRRHLITHSDGIYCVGSVNSIADFMVHKLGEWYGARIARAVEAQFSPEARQSFETAAFMQQSPETHHDEAIRNVQDHLQQHPGDAHSVDSLATMTGLAPRSFTRRFRQATGESPMSYLATLRIREARAMLQHTDLSIADIAWRNGYGSPSRFSQAFREATELTPRQYRAAVRGKRFSDATTAGT